MRFAAFDVAPYECGPLPWMSSSLGLMLACTVMEQGETMRCTPISDVLYCLGSTDRGLSEGVLHSRLTD